MGSACISAAEVDHGEGSALAYRIEEGGKSVVYTGDTGYSDALVALARHADLLISECSYPDGHPANGHLTPSLVGHIAAEAGAGMVVLVHMYRTVNGRPLCSDGLAEGVRRLFDGPVRVGYDGMRIQL
jgi:ribonuclease BN (tRNA processing enzyme)